MTHFRIGRREVGDGRPCFIIAEVAQAHDGSLGAAHAYIDAAAGAGADAIKFQTHIAAAETTVREPWRIKFSRQDATRYDYWKRMEFSEAQWTGLAGHAREAGLVFLSSPFSNEAVDLLERLDMQAWKIGGAEVTNEPLIRRAAATGRPVIVSSGMASWAELDAATELVREASAPLAVMQCSSYYPCPPEKLGLNVLAQMRERFGCPVGLSDHSADVHAGLAAVALGAKLIEAHIVLDKRAFGPDTSSSLTIDQLALLVRGAGFIGTALANPVDKDELAEGFKTMRTTFGKSIVAARDLDAGVVLTDTDIALKKPGDGLGVERLDDVLGRMLCSPVAADGLIAEADLE